MRNVSSDMLVAAFNQSDGRLELRRLPRPSPAAGEVVVRVARCGICTSDLHWSNGHGMSPESGTVLGHEIAGEVVETGAAVTNVKKGDRVVVIPFSGCNACDHCWNGDYLLCAEKRSLWGGFGQYTIAAALSCFKIPDSLSWDEAALVEPLACGAHAVRKSEVSAEANVLVIGGGPIGLACTFWLRQRGVKSITVAARTARNQALATKIGATRFIAGGEELTRRVQEQIGAPTMIFECSGVPGIMMQVMHLASVRARIVIAGMCPTPETLSPVIGVMKELILQFVAAYNKEDFVETIAALGAGDHSPLCMVERTIGLQQLPRAFRDLQLGDRACKILVDPWRMDMASQS